MHDITVSLRALGHKRRCTHALPRPPPAPVTTTVGRLNESWDMERIDGERGVLWKGVGDLLAMVRSKTRTGYSEATTPCMCYSPLHYHTRPRETPEINRRSSTSSCSPEPRRRRPLPRVSRVFTGQCRTQARVSDELQRGGTPTTSRNPSAALGRYFNNLFKRIRSSTTDDILWGMKVHGDPGYYIADMLILNKHLSPGSNLKASPEHSFQAPPPP